MAQTFKYKSIKTIWMLIAAGAITGLCGGTIYLLGTALALPIVAIAVIVAIIASGAIYTAMRGEEILPASKRIKRMVRNSELKKITDFDLTSIKGLDVEMDATANCIKLHSISP
jgi:hypothetical protein